MEKFTQRILHAHVCSIFKILHQRLSIEVQLSGYQLKTNRSAIANRCRNMARLLRVVHKKNNFIVNESIKGILWHYIYPLVK